MRLFKSKERNTFHYVTTVTYNRVKIFDDETAPPLLSGGGPVRTAISE